MLSTEIEAAGDSHRRNTQDVGGGELGEIKESFSE